MEWRREMDQIRNPEERRYEEVRPPPFIQPIPSLWESEDVMFLIKSMVSAKSVKV